MTESYLSKLMNFATQAENQLNEQEKTQKNSETRNCLPSFLLKDEEDNQKNVNIIENDDDDGSNSDSMYQRPKRKLGAPKRPQNRSANFFNPEDIKKMNTFSYTNQPNMSPQLHSQFAPRQNLIFQPQPQQPNINFYPNNQMNYNYQNYQYQQLHPPQQGNFMHNASSFNYTPVNNVLSQNYQLNNTINNNIIPRMNSFNFSDGISLGPPTAMQMNNNSSVNLLHNPTNRIQSQNNFYCTLSNNNSIILPPHKKTSSISPSKRKKKAPKKSTADSDSLSITSVLSLTDNELYSYIITQKGSREIQSILKKVTESEVDSLISKLSSHFSDIMIDKYGNYFSQRLIQICSPNQRVALLKSIQSRFTEICINSFGTHPLQSLIEIVNMPKEREILLQCIEGHELELALDSKGTHVIQKFISCSSEEERGNVDRNIIAELPKMINDSFGVCVLIKLIKQTTDESIKETIAKYIAANNALSFIQNPYANYVVQSLFNQNDIHLCRDIINTIVDHFFSLSMQKFSSNVVENCIRYSDESVVKKIYNDIISTGKLGSMLNNTYGNFVIEKLIARLSKEEKAELIKEITKMGKEKNLSNTIMNLLYK